MDRSKTADEFILSHQQWQEILSFLRDILLSTGLDRGLIEDYLAEAIENQKKGKRKLSR